MNHRQPLPSAPASTDRAVWWALFAVSAMAISGLASLVLFLLIRTADVLGWLG